MITTLPPCDVSAKSWEQRYMLCGMLLNMPSQLFYVAITHGDLVFYFSQFFLCKRILFRKILYSIPYQCISRTISLHVRNPFTSKQQKKNIIVIPLLLFYQLLSQRENQMNFFCESYRNTLNTSKCSAPFNLMTLFILK